MRPAETKRKPKTRNYETALWRIVRDYVYGGPELPDEPPRSLAPFLPVPETLVYNLNIPTLEADRSREDRIVSIDLGARPEAQRLRNLELAAADILALRLMEQAAWYDHRTLAKLVRFDLRYLGMPQVLEAIYQAKILTIRGTKDQRDASREFLDDISAAIRSRPKGPSVRRVDLRHEYRQLLKVFESLPPPVIVLRNIIPLLGEREIVRGFREREYPGIARQYLQLRYEIKDDALQKRLSKTDDWLDPYYGANALRDWKIVRGWLKRNCKGIIASDLLLVTELMHRGSPRAGKTTRNEKTSRRMTDAPKSGENMGPVDGEIHN